MIHQSPQISIQINNYIDPLNSTIQHPNQIFSPNNLSSSSLSPVNQLSPIESIIHSPPLEESNSTSENVSPRDNKLSSSTSSRKSSNDSDENDICSICLETIDLEKNDSIRSCSCTHKLHINCLIKWIEYKNSIYCEICQDQYSIPYSVLLQYYNQQSLNNSEQHSYNNSYNNNLNNYNNNLNNYNNDNDNNIDNDNNNIDSDNNNIDSDNDNNNDSEMSDDNYEDSPRLQQIRLDLERIRDMRVVLLCALIYIVFGGLLILIYQFVYIKK